MRFFSKKSSPKEDEPSSPTSGKAFKKYQEAFEKARQDELRKLDLHAEKLAQRFRSGSVIIRLDLAVKQSTKKLEPSAVASSEVPVTMPKELSEVLSSPLLRNAFRMYLRKKYAGESLMLFETIEMFKKIASDEWRVSMAEGMMATFIDEDSQYAVNISSGDRTDLIARKKTSFWPQESFDSVQREMYLLMNTNHFSGFCRTYWPGGVLIAIPGGPFANDTIPELRGEGSTTSINELGSGSTVGSQSALLETVNEDAS